MHRRNTKEKELQTIRYHWASYVARGGFNEAKTTVGALEKGGVEHWTLFLQIGRKYLKDYPKDTHILEDFVPPKMLKLLKGE